ncbi:MAG: histidine phosphatase family protein [Tenuifilaceae bacterium]|nr:histidine phosphatase family protein [Tenuifilaceae bacterium]
MSSIKTLFIVRHAKSSWGDADLSDFDRSLDKRGIKDAQLLFSHWATEFKRIEHIATSPANRAWSTSMLFCQTADVSQNLISNYESLYEASTADVYEVVKSFSNDISAAALVGHNPSLTYFVNQFIKRQIDNLPTTGIVKLVFNCTRWNQISRERLVDSKFDFPKNH